MMKSVASWNNLTLNPCWYFVTFKRMRRLWKNTTRIRLAMKYSLISMQIKTKQVDGHWSHHEKTGEFREIQLNQQTIRCQVLAWVKKIWSCLLFIKLYKVSLCYDWTRLEFCVYFHCFQLAAFFVAKLKL
jgi:hypothetical protein